MSSFNQEHPAFLALLDDSMRILEFHLVKEKLASHTSFPLARELALALVPEFQVSRVSTKLQETAEARRFLERGSALDLAEAQDVREVLQRAALGGVLSGEELRQVHDTLRVLRRTRSAGINQREFPLLGAAVHELPLERNLEKELAASIGKNGEVLDGASPILRELRDQVRTFYQTLADHLERTVRRLQRQNVLQEPIITQRNGRMVLLVKTEFKFRLPGIVHDVSDSGATVFVEPMAAVGPGNQWRESVLSQEREEERVMRELSARIGDHGDDIARGLELLAHLDLAMSKGRYSMATRAILPTIIESDHRYISLVDARHPLLEGNVVPVTLKLGGDWGILLITGPNAGGKTVALKTLGLVSLMVQAGLHVPAEEATLTIFEGVFADIGDQQSIERSLSTFSSHTQTLRTIMEHATSRSMVLLDELGTSTDPEEGAALAKAILSCFLDRDIALAATTHQRDVAAFVQEQPRMVNASVELEPGTLAPTYRLTLGLPGRSYALTIAARMGLDSQVVERAKSMLAPGHRQAEGLLQELQAERHLAQVKREEAEGALSQANVRNQELEAQLAELQDNKAQAMEEARHQLRQQAEDVIRRLRRAEKALEQPPAPPPFTSRPDLPAPVIEESPTVKEAIKEIAQVRSELRSTSWQPVPSRRDDWLSHLKEGDRVYLKGIPQPVEVLSPPGEDGVVEVLLGTMRARLPAHQLDRPAQLNTSTSREAVFLTKRSRTRASTELDLRGRRVDEALDLLETFLDDGVTAGLSNVRVVHGVGTGALRNAIRDHLVRHPLVKSAQRDENRPGDGTTMVELT